MKKIMYVALAALAMVSCETIQDDATLENTYTPDGIEVAITYDKEGQKEGGNTFTVSMLTPGVMGYWDFLLGTKYSDAADVLLPFTGTHTMTYHSTIPYIEVDPNGIYNQTYPTKTIDVTVNEISTAPNEHYGFLCGADFQGKTWVFDGVKGDGGKWYSMTDPNNWQGVWWDAGGSCCPPGDYNGSMSFDLAGAANYYYRADRDGEATKGSFVFSTDYKKITFVGAPIIGAEKAGTNTTFEIKVMNDETMTLFCVAGTGWIWRLRPM